METIAFNAEAREIGIKAKSLRKEGKIPAVLYGPDVLEHLSVQHNDVKKLIFTPDFVIGEVAIGCLLYTSPSPRDATLSRMPSSA